MESSILKIIFITIAVLEPPNNSFITHNVIFLYDF
jgi:hypothetical protein